MFFFFREMGEPFNIAFRIEVWMLGGVEMGIEMAYTLKQEFFKFPFLFLR